MKKLLTTLCFMLSVSVGNLYAQQSYLEYGIVEVPELQNKELQKLMGENIELIRKYNQAIQDNDSLSLPEIIKKRNEWVKKINDASNNLTSKDLGMYENYVDRATEARRTMLGLGRVPELEDKEAQKIAVKLDTLITNIISVHKKMSESSNKIEEKLNNIKQLEKRLQIENKYQDYRLLQEYSKGFQLEGGNDDKQQYGIGKVPKFQDKETQEIVNEVDVYAQNNIKSNDMYVKYVADFKELMREVKQVQLKLEKHLQDDFIFGEYVNNTIAGFSEAIKN